MKSFFKNHQQTFWIGLILVSAISGCTKEYSAEDGGLNPSIALTLQDERYGTGARQVADVYLPPNRNSSTKVLVMLHGGSWAQGDKADIIPYITVIRAQMPDVAIVNMNYTLANGTPATQFPAQMNDIKQLVDYIANQASIWNVGTSIGITGISAGGHLGLLYSYAYDNPKRVKAVVSIVGPTDFSDPLYTSSPLFQVVAKNFLGKAWSEDANLHRSASPALRVTATSPPTFMAYGTIDAIVPITNAFTLRASLVAAGVTHTYLEYPNNGHELSPAAITDLLPRSVAFLRVHL
jgi:acetyl esterase/lipase